MDNQLIHLALREQLALMAGMPWLTTALAAGRCAAWAGRGTRGIAGRRAGGVARVALALLFEVRDPRLERLDLVEQGQHHSPDTGRSCIPVSRGNAEGRCRLAHGGSMWQKDGVVKPRELATGRVC